jgi:hypothetical protein
MSTALIVSAFGALALTSGIAFAAVEAPKGAAFAPDRELTRAQVEARVAEQFKRMDVDSDGKLTPADRDAARTRMADTMFERLDADRNGAISRDEWNAGAARLAAAHQGAGRRGMHGRPGMRGAGFIARADGNDDGAVTLDELRARALARFDRADADKDGKISAAEREQARAAMRGRPGS